MLSKKSPLSEALKDYKVAIGFRNFGIALLCLNILTILTGELFWIVSGNVLGVVCVITGYLLANSLVKSDKRLRKHISPHKNDKLKRKLISQQQSDNLAKYIGEETSFRDAVFTILGLIAFTIYGGAYVYKAYNNTRETPSIPAHSKKESPYLYEDKFFLGYQKIYNAVWAWCATVGKLEVDALGSSAFLRAEYEKNLLGNPWYPVSAKELPVWHSKLKESLRDMKPSSSDRERHAELVTLCMSVIAARELEDSEVSARQFAREAMEIQKDFKDSYRRVSVYVDVD